MSVKVGLFIEAEDIHSENGEEIEDITEQYKMLEGDTMDLTIEVGNAYP